MKRIVFLLGIIVAFLTGCTPSTGPNLEEFIEDAQSVSEGLGTELRIVPVDVSDGGCDPNWVGWAANSGQNLNLGDWGEFPEQRYIDGGRQRLEFQGEVYFKKDGRWDETLFISDEWVLYAQGECRHSGLESFLNPGSLNDYDDERIPTNITFEAAETTVDVLNYRVIKETNEIRFAFQFTFGDNGIRDIPVLVNACKTYQSVDRHPRSLSGNRPFIEPGDIRRGTRTVSMNASSGNECEDKRFFLRFSDGTWVEIPFN